MRNAPPPEEWLGLVIAALAPTPPVLPEGLPARLGLLLDLLRARRCLLVLDNLETVLEPGTAAGRYRAGYEGYGEVLRQVGESAHQSSLLLTSREAPPELALLAGETAPVRTLRLGGPDLLAARPLLADKGLAGDETAWAALVGRYGGSPLALRVVGQSIAELFGGEIAPFLAYVTESYGAVFGGIRLLLDAQVARLAPLGRSVLYWLAVEREPVGLSTLAANLGPGVGRGALLEALAGLGQRSLLEHGVQGGTHTLQPVVLEYATERLVAEVGREVVAGEPRLLISHALVQATARDYVRRSQERLLAQPLLEQLRTTAGSGTAVERRLLALLDLWRGRPAAGQGYGPGNVVNLLRLLRGDLRGVDLSRLSIRQAYLAEVEAQDASLAGGHLAEAVLAEAFTYPASVALSADGALLAAGTATGEVRLWRVADRTLLLVLPGHRGPVPAVTLSADGRLLASGSEDGAVRLWEAESGRPRATPRGHGAGVWGVALSADGRLLASGGQDGAVRLWEAETGRALATLRGHTAGVFGVALSGDGRLLASGSEDATVRLWEMPGGRPLVTLRGHSGTVRAVALSGDARLRARALLGAGCLARWEGDYAQARLWLERLLALGRTLDDVGSIGAALATLGTITHLEGQTVQATELLTASLELCRPVDNKLGAAEALAGLGKVAWAHGEQAAALALLAEALALFREIGDTRDVAITLCDRAVLVQGQGYDDQAQAALAEGIALCRELRDRSALAYAVEVVTRVRARHEPPERLARLLGAAAALDEAIPRARSPIAGTTHDQVVERVQAALPAQTFASACTEGRAMTIDEVIEQALRAVAEP